MKLEKNQGKGNKNGKKTALKKQLSKLLPMNMHIMLSFHTFVSIFKIVWQANFLKLNL